MVPSCPSGCDKRQETPFGPAVKMLCECAYRVFGQAENEGYSEKVRNFAIICRNLDIM